MQWTNTNGTFMSMSNYNNTAGNSGNTNNNNSNNYLMHSNSLNNLQYAPPPPPPFFSMNPTELLQGNPSPSNLFMDPLKAAAIAAGESISNIP